MRPSFSTDCSARIHQENPGFRDLYIKGRVRSRIRFPKQDPPLFQKAIPPAHPKSRNPFPVLQIRFFQSPFFYNRSAPYFYKYFHFELNVSPAPSHVKSFSIWDFIISLFSSMGDKYYSYGNRGPQGAEWSRSLVSGSSLHFWGQAPCGSSEQAHGPSPSPPVAGAWLFIRPFSEKKSGPIEGTILSLNG